MSGTDKFLESIRLFFYRNRFLLPLVFAAGLFAYGYEICNVTYSIDEELMWRDDPNLGWTAQQRWGMMLFRNLVLPQIEFPFISAVTGLAFLSFAYVLFVDRHTVPFGSKAVFGILAISFPTFAYVQAFSYMSAFVGAACFLIIAAYELWRTALAQKRWGLLGIALALNVWALGTHQSLAYLFFAPLLLDALLDNLQETPTLRASFTQMVLGGVFMTLSVGGYFLVNKLLNFTSDGYIETTFSWSVRPAQDILYSLYYEGRTLLLGRSFAYPLIPFLAIPTLGLLLSPRRAYLLLMLLMLAAYGVGMHLIFGTWMPGRSTMYYPLLFAGLFYMFSINTQGMVRLAVFCFTFYAFMLHSALITRLFLADSFRVTGDVVVATRVLDRVYDVAPKFVQHKTPIALVGRLVPSTTRSLLMNDVHGGSFWNWDNGNPHRMAYFLVSLGMPVETTFADADQLRRAALNCDNMPVWPDKDSVQLRDGLVNICLSRKE